MCLRGHIEQAGLSKTSHNLLFRQMRIWLIYHFQFFAVPAAMLQPSSRYVIPMRMLSFWWSSVCILSSVYVHSMCIYVHIILHVHMFRDGNVLSHFHPLHAFEGINCMQWMSSCAIYKVSVLYLENCVNGFWIYIYLSNLLLIPRCA